jgi:flagellar biosynthesis protein FlhF
MNIKRFTARNSREALGMVRLALGDDAVVLSTRPCDDGIEVLAMAPDGLAQIERAASQAATMGSRQGALAPRDDHQAALAAHGGRAPQPAPRDRRPSNADATEAPATERRSTQRPPLLDTEVGQDMEQLAMSTLSFQDYVRERMLKRRQAALKDARSDEPPSRRGKASVDAERPAAPPASSNYTPRTPRPPAAPPAPVRQAHDLHDVHDMQETRDRRAPRDDRPYEPPYAAQDAAAARPTRAPRQSAPHAGLDDGYGRPHEPSPALALPSLAEPTGAGRNELDMVNELRSMKGLIEERFGALAFMDKLQRQPRQALLAQRLMDSGFSPALIRKLVDALPEHSGDEAAWAANVLERNLLTDEAAPALEDQGGVFALIGSTGVGKTTSTAKIAAAFATRHGAAHLGLITLDAYRVAAHEQLRTYGRILGVPVHTAHDRASLEDLLDLLSAKKMVLIDTAGMAQRDSRARELLDMLSHRSIHRLLVIDASSQGETTEDVITSWRASQCKGVVLSKIDEAVKLAPALDAVIRHKLKVIGVANGQRVPEDWHRLSANALVHRAMRGTSSAAYRFEADDVQLVFATASPLAARAPRAPRPHGPHGLSPAAL